MRNKKALRALEKFLAEEVPGFYVKHSDYGEILKDETRRGALGTGCSRVVILREFHGVKFAIKLSYGAHAADNRTEWELYQAMKGTLRKITARPYAISECGRAVGFEYVPQTLRQHYERKDSDSDYADTWRLIDEAKQKFQKRVRSLLKRAGHDKRAVAQMTTDNHPSNIGVRSNGEHVWLDFASV